MFFFFNALSVRVHKYVHVCVLRPEDNLRSHLQELFPPPLVFFIGFDCSERHPPISASPELGLQYASLCVFTWALGIKYISLHLQGKHSINWAISPVSEVCVSMGKTFYEGHRKPICAQRWFLQLWGRSSPGKRGRDGLREDGREDGHERPLQASRGWDVLAKAWESRDSQKK